MLSMLECFTGLVRAQVRVVLVECMPATTEIFLFGSRAVDTAEQLSDIELYQFFALNLRDFESSPIVVDGLKKDSPKI
jgi:hypothetical protein